MPPDDPVVLVVGAMAHGSVSTSAEIFGSFFANTDY